MLVHAGFLLRGAVGRALGCLSSVCSCVLKVNCFLPPRGDRKSFTMGRSGALLQSNPRFHIAVNSAEALPRFAVVLT